MRNNAIVTGKTNITHESTGKYKIWSEVKNVNVYGERCGGSHFAPLHPREFCCHKRAQAAIDAYVDGDPLFFEPEIECDCE